jgi:hypothetical protein
MNGTWLSRIGGTPQDDLDRSAFALAQANALLVAVDLLDRLDVSA